MRRYLDLSSWVILFTLLPFTVLILLSQNTVPGDLFYPVKRGLENIILAGSSISPATKVAFRTDLTERRFKEAEQLLVLQADTRPLSALVGEVQVAQEELFKLSSFEDKKELSEKLIAKIDEYETKLAVVQTQIEQQPIQQVPQQPVQTQPTPVPAGQTPAPTVTPVAPTPETAKPTQTVPPATQKPFIQIPFQPQATPVPTPAPILNTVKKEDVVTKVEDTREKLKEFKEKLKKEQEDAEAQEKFKKEQERFREIRKQGERENSGRNEDDD